MKQMLALFVILVCSVTLQAQSSNGSGIWSTLSSPAMDPAKSAIAENVEIVRDRVHITLKNGTIQFLKPVNGVAFGATFHGEGRVQLDPPNAIEAQQLKFFTKQDKLDMTFSDATFSFTDGLLEEVGTQVKWKPSASTSDDLYTNRQKLRESRGLQALPRLLRGIMSSDQKRTAFFLADLKTANKGWVDVSYDAMDPEQIQVGRWVDLGGFQAFDLWMSFPAGGVTSSDAWKDPGKNADFLVKAYKIDANVNANADLEATTKVTLEPHTDGETVIFLELDSNLRLDSVKDERGMAVAFQQAPERKDQTQSYGDYLVVMLDAPLKVGTNRTLDFHYAGKRAIRKVGDRNYFCESSGWYPERSDSFSERSDFELTFHSPKNTLLVATGNKTGESVDGNTRMTTWKSEIPLAVAGFAYGDYKIYNDKSGDVAVDVYANREPDDIMASVQRAFDSGRLPGAVGDLSPSGMAKTMGIEMANTIRVFSNYFGPYPYKHLSVTSLPISYSYGQGWPGLIYLWSGSFLDSTQRHEIGLKDGVELTDFFRGHESSHQWWGHRVGWKSYHDQWLSEGFAEFSGNLYVQYRESMKEYVNRWKREKELLHNKDLKNHTVESIGPIWMGQRIASSETDSRSYQDLIYSKGGFVLHMLRMQLWDARNADPDHLFKAMMQDYCKTFDNQAASTEDFKAIVEKHMTKNMDLDGNRKMDWFFNQYVYGIGVPEYSLHVSLTPAPDGKTTVSGSLDRSGVPETWKDAVPLYVHSGDKVTRIGTLAATHQSEKINFIFPQKVDRITINEYEDLLADVK
jgi:Peptidase family M1 domain